MAKEKSVATGGLLSEVFNVGIYKRNQGRYARQITFLAIAVIVLLAGYRMADQPFVDWFAGSEYLLPGIFVLVCGWLSWRLVNYPKFADFLIAVEAEMYKVSWPTWPELIRSSMVVIIVIIGMAIMLGIFDVIWRWVFSLLGVAYGS